MPHSLTHKLMCRPLPLDIGGTIRTPLMPGLCLTHWEARWSKDGTKLPPTGSVGRKEKEVFNSKTYHDVVWWKAGVLGIYGTSTDEPENNWWSSGRCRKTGTHSAADRKRNKTENCGGPLSAACTLEAVIGDRQRERSAFISHTDSQTCFLSSRTACSVATGTIQDAHRQCHFYKSAKDWTWF